MGNSSVLTVAKSSVGMDIQPLSTDEATTIVDLWTALTAGQREYGAHILGEENRTQIRETVLRHAVGDRLLVAREEETDDRGTEGRVTAGNTILGFVMFRIETGSFTQDLTRGIIENLYVIPGRRNEGIGSALLEAAERRLSDDSVDAIALEVLAENELARSFYRRRGYTPHRLELEKSVD